MLERGTHSQDLGIRLRLDEAGKSIAILAAHALAVGHIRLVEHDAAGRVERMVACAFEVVGELLDTRFVGDGGEGIRLAAWRLGGILAACAVDMIHALGFGVVGFKILVAQRPCGRDAILMFDDAEILLAQPVESGAVELGRAADEVMDAGLESLAVLVAPGVLRCVAVCDEDFGGGPVFRLAREPAAALEDEDAFAGGSEVTG